MSDPIEILHKELMNDIAGDIDPSLPDEWSKLTHGLRDSYLASAEIAKAENFRDIGRTLIQKGHIQLGQYDILEEIIKDINQQTYEKIQRYKDKMEQVRNNKPIQNGKKSSHTVSKFSQSHFKTLR